MIEYTMTFGHGTASIARGVDDIIAFAQYNCPSNIEIIVANNDLGLDARAPFYIFKDNSTNKQEYKFAISLDDVIDTFREYGLNADGTKFNTYKNVYKIATVEDTQTIGMGYIFDDQFNNDKTKCVTSDVFENARNTRTSIKVQQNTGINYASNQLMCKNDIITNNDTINITVYLTNIFKNKELFGKDGEIRLSVMDEKGNLVYDKGQSIKNTYIDSNKSINKTFSISGLDFSKHQYYFKAHAWGKYSNATEWYWRFPKNNTNGYGGKRTAANGGTDWILIQPVSYKDITTGTERYGSLFNCYNNQHHLKGYAGKHFDVDIRFY